MFLPRNLWFFPFLLSCGVLLELCCSQGLTVIGPKVIRPNRSFNVAFSNSLSKAARFEVILANSEGDILYRGPVSIQSNSLGLRKIPVASIESGDYIFSIKSVDSHFNFEHEVDLEYNPKTMSVFIQTDKPVYNPGDLLRFRVVMIDADTRPVTNIKSFKIGLIDSDENSIRQWPYAKLRNGVFQSAVQLASSPVLGNWNFTVTIDEETFTKQVELKEYVLPKFYLKVTAPELLLIDKGKIKLFIESSYTFGGDVDGTAKVDLYYDETRRLPVSSKKFHITGKGSVEFPLTDEFEMDLDEHSKKVIVKVSMMEAFSNRTVNVTEYIPVYREKYQISVISATPMFWRGVPLKTQVVIKDHYGSPPKGKQNVKISINYDGDVQLVTKQHNNEGVVDLDLTPPVEATKLDISVNYDSVDYENIKEIYAAESASNQYIKIALSSKSRVRVNKDVIFVVTCTERMIYYSYAVISRGSIVAANNVKAGNKKQHQFRLKLEPEMSPQAKIIVFYTKNNFIVYDTLDLDFAAFTNNFKVWMDKTQYVAGETCTIEMDAAEDSDVFLQAIDQSALLLGRDGHDLTRWDLLKDLSDYVSPVENNQDPFHTMGLFLRSTANLDIPVARTRYRRFTSISNKTVSKIIHIRTVFPEAWLWQNYSMGGNPVNIVQDTIPDTITSWFVTGFALSPTLGMGVINQPFEFVVKQPFYMIANLPYSIKRGEVAVVQVTVFNFLGRPITTNVSLYNRLDEIDFVDKSSDDNSKRTKTITVPNSSGLPVSFLIKSKQLGEIAIKVEAVNSKIKETANSEIDEDVNSEISDAMEHMLRVTPESRMYEKNEPRFIELADIGNQNFNFKINIPREIDEGSAKIMFTLDANMIDSTVKNLDNLIGLPTGCGEQNMLHFAPNIVILDYLEETDKLTPQLKTKVLNYMSNGYQNQLKYKRSDGSFSVWGSSDASGSTFLTAFVAKCFKLADKYMDKIIDKNVVLQAFRWLAKKQHGDGRFLEVGSVSHRDMQGGLTSTSYALTAFVAIAFLENPHIAREHSAAMAKTVSYLANNFYNMNDVYDLSLTSYALSLYRHPKTEDFRNKLAENSILAENGTHRYWSRDSVNVEVAGYALLTSISEGQITDGRPIMNWLTTQRFASGGFSGIQSTFVGLKSLAKFAAKTSVKRNNLRVTLKYKPNKVLNFDVQGTNLMKPLQQELPNDIREVDVQISGIGIGMIQVAYQYYLNIQQAKPSFNLVVDLLNTTTQNAQYLSVCVSYKPPEAYDRSNMALVEVFFPSGIIAEENAVTDLSPTKEIKRTELRFGATSVVVYYEYLGKQKNCFEVTAYRRYKVAMHRPAYVVVYDYDDRNKFAIQMYEGKVLQLCDICDDEDCTSLSC